MVEKIRVDETGSCQNGDGKNRATLEQEKLAIEKLEKIDFFRHALAHQDKAEVEHVLDGLFLTTGSTVAIFENLFSVGVMSCTHALELCLRYYAIGSGDEVITTPLSFVATANVIEYVGATPIFEIGRAHV